MKRLFSLLLAICLIAGMAIPARAAEELENKVSPEEPMEEIVTVSTLDELIAAIESAADGGVIAVTQKITISGETILCDKDITIARSADFVSGDMFSIVGCTISGLRFKETLTTPDQHRGTSIMVVSGGQETVFENCIFDGNGAAMGIEVFGYPSTCYVRFNNCEFMNCDYGAVCGNSYTDITTYNCYIHDNYSTVARGALHSSGALTVVESMIVRNTAVAGAGVNCSGSLTITNCQIKNNIATNENDKVAVDVFSTGTWSITDAAHEEAGYYDVTTGLKVELPIAESTDIAKLIYLSDDDAAEYFAPAPAPDDTELPGEDTNTPETGEDDPDESDEDSKPETPSEEPQQPQTPGGTDPDDEQNQPNEPPVTPQEPSDNSDDDEDDYTPPASHRPVYRPSKPAVTFPEPEPAPALACGDVAIDVSRSVILEGYGDGQLHLEDTLSRAQMATIIYRLLDADSIKKYDTSEAAFVDVPADAWYFRYVTAIAKAGVVCGIGDSQYNPDGKLTWAQIITVLTRFVEAEEYNLQTLEYDGWALPAVETAVALGWIEDSNTIDLNKAITRGEFVAFVNSVIEKYR